MLSSRSASDAEAQGADGAELRLRVLASTEDLPAADWDSFPGLPPFLHSKWLRVFTSTAQGGAGGPSTQYVQVLRGREVIAQTICQTLAVPEMKLGGNVRPKLVAVALGDEAFQLGQALFSGAQGSIALPGEELGALLNCVQEGLGHSGPWFIKDVAPGTSAPGSEWGFLEALPEMLIELPSTWRSFDDYLSALPSKYRTRARRARGKLGDIKVRELSTQEVVGFGESLQGLYERLMARTSHAPFTVERDYVPRLKAALPAEVSVLGFLDGEVLIGFATLLVAGEYGLAHVAAVDEGYNATHQLYLNMLFALLEVAIRRECCHLNYGRTATTIKSSVGAAPVYYDSYVRHTGCVRNQLVRQLVERVVDPADAGALVQRPLG